MTPFGVFVWTEVVWVVEVCVITTFGAAAVYMSRAVEVLEEVTVLALGVDVDTDVCVETDVMI